MKEIITVNDMRESDLKTIESGIPGIELMYRAALGVYNAYDWKGKIGIFCGSGNNAGDGYALALILQKNGFTPEVILVSNKFSEDGLYYYNLCLEFNVPVKEFINGLEEYDIYVDALLGTGFNGEPRGLILECIKYLNKQKNPVISVDINSGLNGDNGLCINAVKSDLTVSIGYLKPGLLLNQAKDYINKLTNIDIGIKRLGKPFFLLEKKMLKNLLNLERIFRTKVHMVMSVY